MPPALTVSPHLVPPSRHDCIAQTSKLPQAFSLWSACVHEEKTPIRTLWFVNATS